MDETREPMHIYIYGPTDGKATYQYTPELHGLGSFFVTDCCGNEMYHVADDPMAYHGCLCPRCFNEGRHTVIYLRGTKEANEVMSSRGIFKEEDV